MKTDLKSKDTNESLKHINHSGIFVMSGNVVLNEEEGNSTIEHKLDLLQYLDSFHVSTNSS